MTTSELWERKLQERPENEWGTLLTAFNLAFSFLNRVFYREPEAELLDTLAAEQMFQEWPLPAANEKSRQGLALLVAFSDRWQRERLRAVADDYARLFIGPGHLLAPPWESVYLSEEHLVFEQETAAVRAFYRKFGVKVPRQNVEPDDHFALELAFLVHLNERTMEAVAAGDREEAQRFVEAQREFLSEHLLLWAPHFLERVREQASTLFYHGAALLAEGVLEYLASLLDLEVQPAEIEGLAKPERRTLAGQQGRFSVREL